MYFLFLSYIALHVIPSKMRLRTRKASQQSNQNHTQRALRVKRKYSDVEENITVGGGKLQKNETGLLSSIKKFIKGSTPKVNIQKPLLHFDMHNISSKIAYKSKHLNSNH